MKLKHLVKASVMGTSLSLVAGAAYAADYEWRYASAAPEGTPWVKHSEKLRDALVENSGGKIEMTLFNNAQLGKETDVIKQVARGRIDLGAFSMSGLSDMVPEFSLTLAPYLWDSYEQLDCAYDNYLAASLAPLLEKKNLKLIQWNEIGFANLFGGSKIVTPEDAQAQKMRASISPAATNFYDAIGLNGIYIPFSEMSSALQTGLIDGGGLSAILYVAAGFGKQAPYYTLTKHSHEAGVIVMNLDLWNSLPADMQQAFDASLAPQQALRDGVRGMDAYLLGKFKEAGGQVTELSTAEMAVWKQQGASKYADLVEDVGGESDVLWPQIMEAKTACAI